MNEIVEALTIFLSVSTEQMNAMIALSAIGLAGFSVFVVWKISKEKK